jgi:hypothetical protein
VRVKLNTQIALRSLATEEFAILQGASVSTWTTAASTGMPPMSPTAATLVAHNADNVVQHVASAATHDDAIDARVHEQSHLLPSGLRKRSYEPRSNVAIGDDADDDVAVGAVADDADATTAAVYAADSHAASNGCATSNSVAVNSTPVVARPRSSSSSGGSGGVNGGTASAALKPDARAQSGDTSAKRRKSDFACQICNPVESVSLTQ